MWAITRAALVTVAIAMAPSAHAQVPVNRTQFPGLDGYFDRDAKERPLECRVFPYRPLLNFSFGFQSGGRFEVPYKALRTEPDALVVLVRIVPDEPGKQPIYLYESANLS